MRAAIALARRGAGRTSPNPSVGCVLVKDGVVLARARTADGGRPHAEAQALAMAGKAAHGATAYVTLEPCSHHGKTPPCADALISAGIKRCVIAVTDPDPRVSGGGIATLRANGVEVLSEVCAEEAATDLRGYITRQRLGRPHVLLKSATTLDGKIATQSGESRWITGADARRWVHLARSQSDAVLVGIGTALADDPMLDVRDMGAIPQPIRCVIDSRLRLDPTCRLARTANDHPLWILHGPHATQAAKTRLAETGARLFEVPTGASGSVDLKLALNCLGTQGLNTVLCEGGAGLAAGLLKAELVDEIAMFCAGKIIGGDGTAAIGDLGLERLADSPKFALTSLQQIGTDTLSIWRAATNERPHDDTL